MISRRPLLVSLAGVIAFAVSQAAAVSALPKGLDTDNDATLDLAEAKKAAATLFDRTS